MKKAALMACAAMAASVAVAGTAVADTPTMDVGAYGGSTENLMKEKIIPAFEAQNDVKIVYVPGNSTDTLAKLQAQKSAEELDVVFLDDGPMYQAVALGFCAPIADAEFLGRRLVARPFEPAIPFAFAVLYPSYRPRARLAEDFVARVKTLLAENPLIR